VGYAATGEVSEKVFAILHGVGANGKSTLVNAIMETLGDYAKQAAPYLLLVKHSSHPIQLANLFGARFVASDETDEGRRLAERLVKKLTGREPRPHKGSPDAPYREEQREGPAPQLWREFPGSLVLDGRDRVAWMSGRKNSERCPVSRLDGKRCCARVYSRLCYCLHHAPELTELRSYLGKRVA
jgi:hypothetical protein